MSEPLRVLMVEDSADDAELMLRFVRRSGRTVESARVQSAEEMRSALATQAWHLVISDYSLPSFSGIEALRLLRDSGKEIPVILVSGTIGEDTAVEALKMGATDYVLKSNLGRLPSAVDRAIREHAVHLEHRKLAEQLVQAQKMEAIGRLTSGVAHDVNNVLAAITSLSEIALDDLQRGQIEQAKANIADILSAQESAARIVRQLLLFSRPKGVSAASAIDFNSAVRSVQGLIRRLAGADVKVTFRLPETPLPVIADPSHIEQIVMNLAVNAKDAMPAGGDLSFSVESGAFPEGPPHALMTAPPGEYVVLAVSDSGCGIPAEIQRQIFEPFFTTKEIGKGTGLGLSVIYGVIREAGGAVVLDSDVGRGTTFRIYWPLARAAVASAVAGRSADASPASLHVLLVEDEPAVRKSVATMLRRRGFTVLEAANGGSALPFVRDLRTKIDLLITDVNMPLMGGRELIATARETRAGLPAIVLSGDFPESFAKPEGAAATRVLAKPFTQQDLLREINEIFRSPA